MQVEVVGSLAGTVLDVAVAEGEDGHVAYFGIGGRLTAIDSSDPTKPREVTATEFGDDIHGLTVVGDTLFIAAGSDGLHVLDIGDRMQPRSIGALDTPGTAEAVAVADGVAFVADGERGLLAVDIADPAVPQVLGALATPRYSRDVVVEDDYAYLAERDLFEAGLRVVDVSEPSAPNEVAFADAPGGGDALALAHHLATTLAYVTGEGGGLHVFDLGDPAAPEHLALVPPLPDPSMYGTPVPEEPAERARDLAVVSNGSAVLLASGRQGVRLIDIAEPEEPSLAVDHPVYGEAIAIAVDRGQSRAYVALGPSGLAVLDMRGLRRFTDAGRVELVGQACDLALSGDHAWVADRSGGVRSIDVSDPAAPRAVGRQAIDEGAPSAVVVDGDYLITGLDVAAPLDDAPRGGDWWEYWRGGLDLAYIADPEHPIGAVTVNRERGIAALAIDRAASPPIVVAAEWAQALPSSLGHEMGLRLFDRSRPLRLKERGYFELTEPPTDVAMLAGVAYVTNRNRGLLTFDVSDPDDPKPLGYVATPGEALGVAVDGARVYVADGSAGVQIVDARQPRYPHLAGRIQVPGRARRVAPAGDRAWVAAMEGGVHLLDVADAFAPRLLGGLATSGEAHDVAARDGYAYAVFPNGAFLVLREGDSPSATATGTPPRATPSTAATATAPRATPSATVTRLPTEVTASPTAGQVTSSPTRPSTATPPARAILLPIAYNEGPAEGEEP